MDKTESSQFELFFELLAERLYKENSLSDITWALCESNPVFKKLFINFFFPNIDDINSIVLEREVSFSKGRPDFSFYHQDQHYIIEVKIYDRDYHFDYREIVPTQNYGWISNYFMAPQAGINVLSWEGFKEELDDFLAGSKSENDKNIVTAYVGYLKKVCSIIKINKMSLNNFASLYDFNLTVKKILLSHELKINSKSKNFTENQSGYSFEYCYGKSNNLSINPWFGIYYEENYNKVCFFVSKNEFKSVFEDDEVLAGEYFAAPKLDDDGFGYWFELSDKYFTLLNNSDTVEDQKGILTNYFDEIIELISKHTQFHVKT